MTLDVPPTTTIFEIQDLLQDAVHKIFLEMDPHISRCRLARFIAPPSSYRRQRRVRGERAVLRLHDTLEQNGVEEGADFVSDLWASLFDLIITLYVASRESRDMV